MIVTFSNKDMSENVLIKVGYSLPKLFQSALNWLGGSSGRAFILIFIVAFGVRAYSWIKISPLLPNANRELGAIAWSLAETCQFANPYVIETGPTAHLPPVPPAILALILFLFGNTWQAGYVFWGLTEMTSAVSYALIPWIAGKLGMGKPAGFIAGVAGALILELEKPTHGEGLAGIALGLMLVAFLKRWMNGRNSFFSSLLLGLGIGASFHVQPPILLVFLGYFAFEIGLRKGNRKFAMSSMLALGVVLACVPWAWRNYNVFHEIFFIRSNLGLELRMGNSPGVAATYAEMDRGGSNYQHPRLLAVEALKVKELGEVEYMRRALDDALNWIKENPGEFLKLTFLRFVHFWLIPPSRSPAAAFLVAFTILAILGIRRIFQGLSLPQRIAVLTPLITYPLIYYLVPFMPRYRAPIDWMIFMLAGVEIWHWISSLFERVKVCLLSIGRS
jgi:hypothetical protein